MKQRTIIKTLTGAFATLLFCSCGNDSEQRLAELQAQCDSLTTASYMANRKYDDLSNYLSEISSCIDSISMQEGLAFTDTDPETGRRLSRTEIRARINDLSSLIDRQRSRIAELTDSLGVLNDTQEIARLTSLVNYLNEQLASKEVQLQNLQTELASSRRSIADLQTTVANAQAENAELTSENENLDRMVVDRTNELNKGWILAKTKKELESMGVVTKGSLVKKSKFNPGAVRTSDCQAIDIRSFNQMTFQSKKKPTLLSQAPNSSYVFEEESKGTWVLRITDTTSFWSLSKVIVIQLQ